MWQMTQQTPESLERIAEEADALALEISTLVDSCNVSDFHEARAVAHKLVALLSQVE